MKKFYSLLKAMMSQDMNIFNYKVKNGSSDTKKILLPIFLAIIIMFSVGTYSYMMAEVLHEVNLTYVMLTIFMLVVSILTFMEGIYKSQGMLFDGKDNDLLFSLPVNKTTIFALRIIKLMIFQFMYNLLFILPSYIVYIYYENPGINFYLLSLLMLFILPIIPTILSSILGYIIKGISNKFKSKKIVQTILSTILFLSIICLSYGSQGLVTKLAENAISINDMITKLYYPIGAYISLLSKFNLITFILLLSVNIIPLILTIYIGSISYFKIISKNNEHTINNHKTNYKERINVSSPVKSLVKKELNRYFSSVIYMFNTSFGILIMVILTIMLCINETALIKLIATAENMSINVNTINTHLFIIYIQLIMFVSCLTSITSSSISLEGKSFNITKSLPIKTETIFLAKILSSLIITLPLMLISDLIFIIKFKLNLFEIFMIICFTIIVPLLIETIGLLVNLKYPKMQWTTEIEVIKQSISTLISIWIGLVIFVSTTALAIKFINHSYILLLLELLFFILASILSWYLLKKIGTKEFQKINV